MDRPKFIAAVERVRRLRMEVPELARVIEITSVEDYKARGWSRPVASIEGPGGSADARIGADELVVLTRGLADAFEAFEREFGVSPVVPVLR